MPGMKLGRAGSARGFAVVRVDGGGVEGACWGLACRPSSPVRFGPFEAVEKCGAGVPVAGHARCCCERVAGEGGDAGDAGRVGGVPQGHRAVVVATGQGAPVRGERDRTHPGGPSWQDRDLGGPARVVGTFHKITVLSPAVDRTRPSGVNTGSSRAGGRPAPDPRLAGQVGIRQQRRWQQPPAGDQATLTGPGGSRWPGKKRCGRALAPRQPSGTLHARVFDRRLLGLAVSGALRGY